MTLPFEYDPDRVKMDQLAKYLERRSFNSRVDIRHTHTHRTDSSTWTTKRAGNNRKPAMQICLL